MTQGNSVVKELTCFVVSFRQDVLYMGVFYDQENWSFTITAEKAGEEVQIFIKELKSRVTHLLSVVIGETRHGPGPVAVVVGATNLACDNIIRHTGL